MGTNEKLSPPAPLRHLIDAGTIGWQKLVWASSRESQAKTLQYIDIQCTFFIVHTERKKVKQQFSKSFYPLDVVFTCIGTYPNYLHPMDYAYLGIRLCIVQY